MVDYKPRPGESPGDHRARVQREVDEEKNGVGAGPSADEKVEAAKADVRAKNQARAQERVRDPHNAVNRLDDAAEKEDQVNVVRKGLAGGVKPIDKKAADAAYKADVSFQGKSADEQAAVAKATPAKPAHSTSTPGSAPVPAGAAAMKAAQEKKPLKVSPEVGARARREPSPAPSASVNAQNNMGTPRGGDKGGVLAGTTSRDDPGELARARAAATKGTRGTSNRQAEAQAARASSARSAASPTRAPRQMPEPESGIYSTRNRAEGFAHILGLGGPSSKVTDKPKTAGDRTVRPDYRTSVTGPATNPAPAAPAPVAPNSGSTAADRFVGRSGMDQIRASGKGEGLPATRKSIGAGSPKMGSEITYGVNNPASPTSKTRAKYNEHIAGGGSTESYWADRDAKKAGTTPKASKAAPVASVEPLQAYEAKVDAQNITPKAPAPPMPAAPPQTAFRPVPPPPMPAPTRVPQNTPMSQQMGGAPSAPKAPSKPAPAASRPAATPPAPPAGPSRPVSAPSPAGPPVSSGPVATPPAPSGGGRSGITTPRSPEIGGGRGGISQGGEHNVNTVGNNNYTHVGDVSHHTVVNNYGTMTGNSVGNASSGGYGGGHGGGGGSRVPSGNPSRGHAGHEPHFNLWVKDVNGMHDLQKNINHLTGKTDGSGHSTAPKRTAGAQQNPLAGSPRATGGSTPAPSTGTGTTHNWTGPTHQNPTSASGNGTANGTP